MVCLKYFCRNAVYSIIQNTECETKLILETSERDHIIDTISSVQYISRLCGYTILHDTFSIARHISLTTFLLPVTIFNPKSLRMLVRIHVGWLISLHGPIKIIVTNLILLQPLIIVWVKVQWKSSHLLEKNIMLFLIKGTPGKRRQVHWPSQYITEIMLKMVLI